MFQGLVKVFKDFLLKSGQNCEFIRAKWSFLELLFLSVQVIKFVPLQD